jgi:hypothetical protein
VIAIVHRSRPMYYERSRLSCALQHHTNSIGRLWLAIVISLTAPFFAAKFRLWHAINLRDPRLRNPRLVSLDLRLLMAGRKAIYLPACMDGSLGQFPSVTGFQPLDVLVDFCVRRGRRRFWASSAIGNPPPSAAASCRLGAGVVTHCFVSIPSWLRYLRLLLRLGPSDARALVCSLTSRSQQSASHKSWLRSSTSFFASFVGSG